MIKPFGNHSVLQLHDFVTNTTIADTKEQIVKFIAYYLIQNNCSIEVENLLKVILTDDQILEKVVIVNDHRLYETVLTIRPTFAYSKEDGQRIEETLFFYKEQAEIIFLYLVSSQSEMPINEFINRGKESMEKNIESLFKGGSPYIYTMKQKQKEKKEWLNFFNKHQESILDFLFDLYNKEKELFNLTKDIEFKEKGDKIMDIVRICAK